MPILHTPRTPSRDTTARSETASVPALLVSPCAARNECGSFLDVLPRVLHFADWQAAGGAAAVCVEWRDALQGEGHWKWLCERLSDERALYLPDGPCPSADWKTHFLRLWPRRDLWTALEDGAAPAPARAAETFSIGVSCRFRPAVANAGGVDKNEGDAVVMPLHQRVAMVRAKRGCSQAAAMRIVMKQEAKAKAGAAGGADASDDPWGGCVAAPEKPPESVIEAQRAKQEAAALALVNAAEEQGAAERARRNALLKPHLGAAPDRKTPCARSFSGPPRLVPGPGDDNTADAGNAADAGADALEAAPPEFAVQVRGLADECTAADVLELFAGGSPALFVPKGVAAVHLVPAQLVPSHICFNQGRPSAEAFVEFGTSETADAALCRDGQRLHGRTVEVFRATSEHVALYLGEVAKLRAAAVAATLGSDAAAEEERQAAAEAARVEAVEAARAAKAAEREQHRRDAAALAASKNAPARDSDGAKSPHAEVLSGEGKENASGARAAPSDAKASIISVDPSKSEVLAMAPGCGLRPFRFERVFGAAAEQRSVYDECGRPAVADVLNGTSGCVLVYGQTGSGKTHTMFGDGPADPRLPGANLGIVPRACEELISAIEARRAAGVQSELRVAYVEVFGDEVTDLLRDGATIGSTNGAAGAVDNSFHAHRWVLDGRVDVPIDSVEGALALIAQGDACKRKAATAMNDRSSRAHCLFILTLVQAYNGVEHESRLFLADLGGSEKLTKSQAADEFKSLVITSGGEEVSRITWAEYYAHRGRLQESLNINVGLFSLQRCIEALLERDGARAEGRTVHVPFADSKLTLLLKDALSGGARTTVLVCASLEPRNAVESIATLRFGEACSQVAMRAGRQADGASALKKLVAEIDAEIAEVQAVVVRDQRWERQVKVRHDTVELKDNFSAAATHDNVEDHTAGVMVVSKDDGLGAKQTVAHEVVANVLVGAEAAEARLEALLQRKRELLGDDA